MSDKKLPEEWEKIMDVAIIDPDGWSFPYSGMKPKSFDAPITAGDFMRRLIHCTIQPGKDFIARAEKVEKEDETLWEIPNDKEGGIESKVDISVTIDDI